MKQEVLKAHWKFYAFFSVLTLITASFLIYYFLFFNPQITVKNFIQSNEGNFLRTKNNSLYIQETINNWSDFIAVDIENKSIKFTEAKKSFEDLKISIDKYKDKETTKELVKILSEYSDKSINLLNNIITISEYFKKVEKAVAAFNSLKTESKSLDEIKKLVADFKNVSETSLSELEKIEAPKELLGIDKDYKDILRQYIESANQLNSAIEKNNATEIEKVGKSADEAVLIITNQLSSDLEAFIKTSDMVTEIKLIKSLEKLGEEKINKLKNQYKI